MGGRAGGNGIDFLVLVFAGRRAAAVLGDNAPSGGCSSRAARGERGGRRRSAGGAVQSDLVGAMHCSADFGLGLLAFLLLALWAVPPWLVVLLGAVAGEALGTIGLLA